ncbi:hypothetical protein [Mesorhizobium sp. M0323]|uniref:hypothetical protein n=1 Tax=unclassified Mesorhizobium TaxID=325217 RepID=UPI0033378445
MISKLNPVILSAVIVQIEFLTIFSARLDSLHLAAAKIPVVRWKRTTGHLGLVFISDQDCCIAAGMVPTC